MLYCQNDTDFIKSVWSTVNLPTLWGLGAQPLTDLTAGYPPVRRNKIATVKSATYFNPKEPFGPRWTDDCQQAFGAIIAKLTSAPVLGFSDPMLPDVLHTDASTTGLSAAVYQKQEGQMGVLVFASWGLTKSESRYPAYKLQFLALKWAVTGEV